MGLFFLKGGEIVQVIEDHKAVPGSLELAVHAGQQVELLETGNDWYLVRHIAKDDSNSSVQEGLVPPSCIKTSMKHSLSKASIENEGIAWYFSLFNILLTWKQMKWQYLNFNKYNNVCKSSLLEFIKMFQNQL